MTNPEDKLNQGILTQFSELSDLSTTPDAPSGNIKLPPKSFMLKAGNGSKVVQVQMGETPSSSSPSFQSPGSATTMTMLTQPPEVAEDSNTILAPPSVKRQLKFPKATGEKPTKKLKREDACCGRCVELKIICLKMANETNGKVQLYQYKVDKKNAKRRAIFYQALKNKARITVLPDCVLEYVRGLYPSPPTK